MSTDKRYAESVLINFQLSPFVLLSIPRVHVFLSHRVCIDSAGNARLQNSVLTAGICYVDPVSDYYP